MTELADSGLTEDREMSLSGHTTPDAKRRYVKRTETQRLAVSRQRRAWLRKQNEAETPSERVSGNTE
jgi:hypothetical protein